MSVKSNNTLGISRTEWDRREEVVSDVVMGNVVKEEASSPPKKGTVNSGYGATDERPLLVTIVGDGRIRMMKISQHNDPVVRELQGYRPSQLL
jgi:hypothetical protein